MSAQNDKIVYMDNNATSQVAGEVVDSMMEYLTKSYGNPSSMYTFGGAVEGAISKGRTQVSDLLGCTPEEIIFTSCGTESDSTAILSALRTYPEKRHVITTRVEHPAVKSLCDNLEIATGQKYRVTRLKVNGEGMLDMAEYEAALSDDTAIVSVMWANNETGVVYPVQEMARMA